MMMVQQQANQFPSYDFDSRIGDSFANKRRGSAKAVSEARTCLKASLPGNRIANAAIAARESGSENNT
jgi:hypothetical protein